jgi:hypothetical protein
MYLVVPVIIKKIKRKSSILNVNAKNCKIIYRRNGGRVGKFETKRAILLSP